MALQVGSQCAGSLANACCVGSQFRIGDHFFDVAQAIGPIAEAIAGNRPGAARIEIVEWPGAAACVTAGQARAALLLATLSLLPAVLRLGRLRLASLRLTGLAFTAGLP